MTKYYYQTEVWNSYLNKTKVLKAQTQWELQIKVDEQHRKWAIEEKRQRERDKVADMKDQAQFLTEEALSDIEAYKSILRATLSVDDRLKWDLLYDHTPFREFSYVKKIPTLAEMEQQLSVPKKSFLEVFLKSLQKKRLQLEEHAKEELQKIEKSEEAKYNEALEQYERDKQEYLEQQRSQNEEINSFRAGFEEGHGDEIEKYVRMVLEHSKYPETFIREFNIAFDPIGGVLVVDYDLPLPTDIPSVVEYKFVASKKEIVPKEMKKKDKEIFYEDVIFQLTIRTIHEVFESVYIPHVKSVVFNGWVHGIDGATGKPFTSCIISCQAEREVFETFNLAYVTPKECVRNLKGLIAGPLFQVAPVRPILILNREDTRFVSSQNVLDRIDESTNLADMDWEAFEHLVRELFSKVFSKEGAEVKVTQASRDGGVDAVAFDPDPIRGGKFVIQAKRYNNVVPVSAVRDLYGTMISEGAAKGILVTTSHFGPDSREFVKDKPISLIDGSNLVYMLQEYGYHVTLQVKSKS